MSSTSIFPPMSRNMYIALAELDAWEISVWPRRSSTTRIGIWSKNWSNSSLNRIKNYQDGSSLWPWNPARLVAGEDRAEEKEGRFNRGIIVWKVAPRIKAVEEEVDAPPIAGATVMALIRLGLGLQEAMPAWGEVMVAAEGELKSIGGIRYNCICVINMAHS